MGRHHFPLHVNLVSAQVLVLYGGTAWCHEDADAGGEFVALTLPIAAFLLPLLLTAAVVVADVVPPGLF
jgi:hypothetical protein